MKMNPQEKAKELVDKFIPHSLSDEIGDKIYHGEYNAKACALILCDEILNLLEGDGKSWDINVYWDGEKHIGSKPTKEYWQSVKQSIQNI